MKYNKSECFYCPKEISKETAWYWDEWGNTGSCYDCGPKESKKFSEMFNAAKRTRTEFTLRQL